MYRPSVNPAAGFSYPTEARMVDFSAAVRRLRSLLERGSASLRGALGIHLPLDPVLERLARDVIDELKSVPIVVPSRDLAEAVLERLKRTDADQSSRDSGDPAHLSDK